MSKKLSTPLLTKTLLVGARDSLLSKKQVEEIFLELEKFAPDIDYREMWVKTKGDLDLKTSLLSLEKTDFFTDELDRLVLEEKVDIAVHSAKDLPDPLPQGLEIIALTKGIDQRDALVFNKGETFETLPKRPRIGTSSLRRIENLKCLLGDFEPVDIRGSVPDRIALLFEGKVDALVVAQAALIRLQLTSLPSLIIPGEVAPLQGKLAVVAKEGRTDLKVLFQKLSQHSSPCKA